MKIVIGCGAKKRDHACPARELYVGNYYLACLRWAESVTAPENIAILSARYGFIQLDKIIEPYNDKFFKTKLPDLQLLQTTADELSLRRGLVLLCAGSDYYKACHLVIPGIIPLNRYVGAESPSNWWGWQMRWYNNNHGRLPKGIAHV